MNRNDPSMTLAAALEAARTQLQAQPLPPQLRERVLAAARPAPLRRPAKLWAWSGAAACAVVLMGSALLMLRLPPPAADQTRHYGAGFVPLVPPERWPQEAAAAWLVRTELPGERLAALGLPYDPARAGDRVGAELLLHPSGEVLAVRLVH